MGEHPLRYRPLAEALATKGFTVYANDHRARALFSAGCVQGAPRESKVTICSGS
jgi:alpha-beta hydrolase superfamily lysophospholipase